MKIQETNLVFSSLAKRLNTQYIILHHRAGNGDIQSIHDGHLAQGWAGCGYHFYIRKNGSVWKGRPVDTIGAHCIGHNDRSVGVCFEGNFEIEYPTEAQKKAGKELITILSCQYKGCEIKTHRDFVPTACPGKNFLVADFVPDDALMSYGEAIAFWQQKGVITSPQTWYEGRQTAKDAEWLCRKTAQWAREMEGKR